MNATTMTTDGMVSNPGMALVIWPTHCVCCGSALKDADSVEAGMGPVCRKRHGYQTQDRPADFDAFGKAFAALGTAEAPAGLWDAIAAQNHRVASNILVRDMAIKLGQYAGCRIIRSSSVTKMVVNHLLAIAALGYAKLSACLGKRLAALRVFNVETGIQFKGPYTWSFVDRARALEGRFDGKTKTWTFASTRRAELWATIRICFAGSLLVSERGAALVTSATPAHA